MRDNAAHSAWLNNLPYYLSESLELAENRISREDRLEVQPSPWRVMKASSLTASHGQ